jgi:hypothetical protein
LSLDCDFVSSWKMSITVVACLNRYVACGGSLAATADQQ